MGCFGAGFGLAAMISITFLEIDCYRIAIHQQITSAQLPAQLPCRLHPRRQRSPRSPKQPGSWLVHTNICSAMRQIPSSLCSGSTPTKLSYAAPTSPRLTGTLVPMTSCCPYPSGLRQGRAPVAASVLCALLSILSVHSLSASSISLPCILSVHPAMVSLSSSTLCHLYSLYI